MKGALCEVILIAGFLGAGKTTLLRNILQWPGDLSKTAILVNEFGKIGIDGELLQGFRTPVYELTNGCICCTIQGDFHSTVVGILDGFHPKRILIEATGVADPFDILSFLKASKIENRISAPKVVTVLAGDLWEGREYFGPLFYNQIKAAELLLFNKVDLLHKEEVPRSLQEIRDINPSCSVVPTHHCHVDPEVLWKSGVGGDHQTEFHLPHAHTEHGSAEEMGYVTFAFEEKSPFRTDCFHRFIEDLPIEMYRVKGFALLEDKRFFVNHVGGKTEWVELDEVGPTKLAFVGWQVNEDETLEALEVCLNPNNM
jgi:G3E family GTPase